MANLNFDIDSVNFDTFFEKEVSAMTENQKEQLPQNLLIKIFTRGHTVNSKGTYKLGFLAKLFILFKALKKRCIIIVEDEENGLTEEEYFKWKKATAKQNYSEVNAGKLITSASFVLGNKELCEAYHRLNGLSGSSAYKYLTNTKNKDYTKPAQWLASMNYVNRFLTHYEANRKRITLNTGLTMADWLVLIHLYHGNLVPSSPIYKEWYRFSFNSSASKIKMAFSLLKQRGYVEKVGVSKAAKIRITALGKDKVNEVLKKYVVNC